MRNVTIALFTVGITMAAMAQSTRPSQADAVAIRQVVQQQDDARNKGDWKAFGALFTEDADQLTSAGEWRRGRAAIEQGVSRTMATAYKGGKYATKVDSIRQVTADTAVADGTFEIANLAAGGSRRGQTSFIFVKQNNAWRIAASRSMVPTAVGATPSR